MYEQCTKILFKKKDGDKGNGFIEQTVPVNLKGNKIRLM